MFQSGIRLLCVQLSHRRAPLLTLTSCLSRLMQIHLPDLNRGWLPTQHVYLRVLTASWSTFESHPFTILSSPSSANSSSPRQGLTLLAANSGNWTSALHALASTESEYEKRDGGVVQVRVIVDGPYGGWTSVGGRGVEEVICIVGGSGVSYLIGVAEEAARAMRETRKGSKLRLVRLVWVIRDYSKHYTYYRAACGILLTAISISSRPTALAFTSHLSSPIAFDHPLRPPYAPANLFSTCVTGGTHHPQCRLCPTRPFDPALLPA